MALTLNDDDIKALNRYIDTLLEAFRSGHIDQYKARADLEHVITAAAADDASVLTFVRTEPSELAQTNGDSSRTDESLWPSG
ncbi:hypothetical protein [Asticcacaulis sp. YBE204]|uniref:hypothetical protein n=1 Tax=Asticcacaulis sp. YBE204 TaxID=1282363 RepID=UPI0003C3B26E|nr:hypothetical protein [Asticcacaulis sp. YBE204]ESQ77066.1 hypothetical protein AEYBE204_18465 [Asticcacaulis sp. YBE204]